MAGVELVSGILIGIITLITVISIVTVIVVKVNSKRISNIHNVYLRKLTNSDASIQDAMNYLKLTNGIEQKLNGEKR